VLTEGKSLGKARQTDAFFSKYKIAQKMSYKSTRLGRVLCLTVPADRKLTHFKG
jgi:hypothetical protein